MRFDIITVFPELFAGVLECGIIRRAMQSGLADIRLVNLRDFAKDKHRSVDDRPYGGGEGMVFMPAPLFEAVEFCRRAEGGKPEFLTEGNATFCFWSPDGKKVYFMKEGDLWEVLMDGDSKRQLTDFQGKTIVVRTNNISTDWKYFYFLSVEDLGDIWMMDVVK